MIQKELEDYFDRLWPICRSITGNGLRETLTILKEIIPIKIHEVPTGTEVFDWVVPKEWNVTDAYIIAPSGEKICDFNENNLHLVNYSSPINKSLSLEDLKKHLHTLPHLPDAIPYVTSYYKENWGFCIEYNKLQTLVEGAYQVVIKSELKNGSMSYGDFVLEGESKKEILLSTYVCHPSMANNELSGPLALAFLYRKIASLSKRKYTYRFVFIPETIGAINYLHQHGAHMKNHTSAGYVLTCCGDKGHFHYKRSRRGNSISDKAAEHFLKYISKNSVCRDFRPDGSDERQYCSPAFNLPIGSLMRTPYYEYPFYHTSLDNKSFISFEALEDSINAYYDILRILELNDFYRNLLPHCEPQLGKRGLYPSSLTHESPRDFLDRILFLLNFCDGENDLISIAEKFGADVLSFEKPLEALIEKGLLEKV